MIDIAKGRYWDLPWSLVDGCTPCSPGCDHCWSAGMTHRYRRRDYLHDVELGDWRTEGLFTDDKGRFDGTIQTHPERLTIPLKRRKPTVYAVWNDLFHEDVPTHFQLEALETIEEAEQHTFLVLSKRPQGMVDLLNGPTLNGSRWESTKVWFGLTVCNQDEADAKIPTFLQVPGKKFLSIEPMLGPVELGLSLFDIEIPDHFDRDGRRYTYDGQKGIDAVILGGETGPGARPMHLDWVRSVRDQCSAAGVPFFLKSLGETIIHKDCSMVDTPYKAYKSRLLDGRTHDELPWAAEIGGSA